MHYQPGKLTKKNDYYCFLMIETGTYIAGGSWATFYERLNILLLFDLPWLDISDPAAVVIPRNCVTKF